MQRPLISDAIVSLVAHFEGFKPCAYRCPANVWTIGYGHTKHVEQNLYLNEPIARMLLKVELQEFALILDGFMPKGISQRCFEAYSSLAYNVGIEAVRRSRSLDFLRQYMNSGNDEHLKRCIAEFKDFNKAGGKILAGLALRREAEIDYWLKGEL